MRKGDKFVLIDTGQVWRVKSVRGNRVVMRWEKTQSTIECTLEDFLPKVGVNPGCLFAHLPEGPERTCYPRGLFAEWKMMDGTLLCRMERRPAR